MLPIGWKESNAIFFGAAMEIGLLLPWLIGILYVLQLIMGGRVSGRLLSLTRHYLGSGYGALVFRNQDFGVG